MKTTMVLLLSILACSSKAAQPVPVVLTMTVSGQSEAYGTFPTAENCQITRRAMLLLDRVGEVKPGKPGKHYAVVQVHAESQTPAVTWTCSESQQSNPKPKGTP